MCRRCTSDYRRMYEYDYGCRRTAKKLVAVDFFGLPVAIFLTSGGIRY